MKKLTKKILKVTGILLAVLIALIFLIPILFKKQITNIVKNEINKSINARVDFTDVTLSLFRRFPKVSIAIENLSVVGTGDFAEDTLLYASRTDISANLVSVIKGNDIKVFGVFLESPRILAKVNEYGKANWDIAKEEDSPTVNSADTTASAFKLSLKKYNINNGHIAYRDESSDTYFEIDGLNHTGSGDFTEDIFTLSTTTSAAATSFTQSSIPWLAQTRADINTDITIDTRSNTYTFKTEEIALNDLKLSATGFFRLVNDSTYDMDIQFQSATHAFKDILSLVPGMYKKDFEKIKTSGEASFKGFVKGKYAPGLLPSYDVELEIRNGSFQYPDLPKAVKNIQLDLHASNPDGVADNAVIDISKGHFEMDNEPFDFRFLLKNPETIKYIDAAAKGKLDLTQVTQFIKLEEGTRLAGLVAADAFVRGNMTAIENQQGNFSAGGSFDIQRLQYASADFPQPITNGNLKVDILNAGGIADNTQITVSSGHIEVGKDPFDFTLQLTHPVSKIDFNGTAKGRFTLDHIKQFTELEPGTSITGKLIGDISFSGNKTYIDKGEYDKINVSGTAGISNLKYISKDYPTGIMVSKLAATFNPAQAVISTLNGQYLGSSFSGSGTLDNLVGFMLDKQPLKGEIDIAVDKMDLNQWTASSGTSTVAKETTVPATESSPFVVPGNLDIVLHAKAAQVKYDKVNYRNINGTLELANETVRFTDVKADALDGSMTMNGSYSTRLNRTNPDMDLSYAIKNMSAQKTFLAFNTVQAIMPIGKFLDGKLNSELTVEGNLDGNMMPDLKTLTGKGNILLIEGVLRKFAPLEKLAATLQIDRLKSVSVKDIKNYIEFANGKVLVKPFTIKVDEIEMQIGGMHGFDQSIDYIIAMKVPRKYLGAGGNQLINGLVSSAANRGLPVKLGEIIDLNVKMGGTLSEPAIKVDLQKVVGNAVEDLKDQAKHFAQQKMDSAKSRVKDTLATVKKQVKDELKEKLKDQLFGKDTAASAQPSGEGDKKPGAAVKDKLKSIFNKPRRQATDTTRNNP